ncbi:MAG: PAS domain S-box protein, partial [Pseudomonadales bacterium]|nr:PAS domain S-box protein [Pseudomonadales bacterium]
MPIKSIDYIARIILNGAFLIYAALGVPGAVIAESWIGFSEPVEMIKLDFERKPIDLFGTVDSYSVSHSMEVLEDISGELTIDQVSSGDYEDSFISSSGGVFNEGITGYSYWIRFTFSSHPSIADVSTRRLWYLEAGRSQLNIAELYTPMDDGSYNVVAADIRKPFSERDVVHVNSVFPVKTQLYEEKTYYLKIRNDNALFVPLTLWNPIAFAEKVAYEEFVYGLFFGGMLIMAFYNVFVFLSVRDEGYLYYFLYVFSIAFWQFIENGHGLTIFGDGGGMLSKYYLPQLLMFSFLMVIQFTRVFLETEKDMPGVELIFNIFKMTVLVSAVSALFVDYISAQIWMSGLSLCLMLMLLIAASFSWAGGNESARYFFVGVLATVTGGIVFVLVLEGVLPATPLLLASAPMGTLAGAVLLSFALADRIKFLQSTALAANQRSMESLSKFRSIFDNAVEGMYRMTLDGSIVSANLSMAKLLGYNSVDRLLASGVEASNVCYSDPVTQYNLLSKEGVFQTEIAYEKLGGGDAWGRHSAQLILDASGKPSHIEGTLVDITARKEKEQAERERERNRVEKEVASASASAKGEFLANMSHEI